MIRSEDTLVEKIKKVSNLPAELSEKVVDREEAMKELIEPYRKDHPLLEEVIRGNTTFEDAYNPLISKYEGLKSWLLVWPGKEQKRLAEENQKIAYFNVDKTIANSHLPFFGLAAYTGVLYGLSLLFPNPSFYMTFFGFAYVTTVIGGIGSVLRYVTVTMGKNRLKDDLKLLDETIKKVYK